MHSGFLVKWTFKGQTGRFSCSKQIFYRLLSNRRCRFLFFLKSCSDYLPRSTGQYKWRHDFNALFAVTFRKSRQYEQKGEVFPNGPDVGHPSAGRGPGIHAAGILTSIHILTRLFRFSINLGIKIIHVLKHNITDVKRTTLFPRNVSPGCILTLKTTKKQNPGRFYRFKETVTFKVCAYKCCVYFFVTMVFLYLMTNVKNIGERVRDFKEVFCFFWYHYHQSLRPGSWCWVCMFPLW